MILKQIDLEQFRNFEKKNFTFNPFLTIIIGPNSAGKTNLLEGIFLSIYGSGFRESKEEELINFEAQGKTSMVTAVLGTGETKRIFRVALTKHKEAITKSFFVDKSKKTLRTYLQEQTKAVLFAPSHIEIVTGSPSARREYFNKIISSFDFEYKKRLSNFEQALRRRNKILEKFYEQTQAKEQLSYWDSYLAKESEFIVKKRQEYVDFLNSHNKVKHLTFNLEYITNEFTIDEAKKRLDLELKIKRTTIGPQKDEFIVWIRNDHDKDVHHFGSRSEQRLAVFWLKMNEIYYLEEVLKIKPLLLFDDIFSEFDMKNKKLVLDLIKQYQSVMTTTEVEVVDLAEVSHSIIEV